MRVKDSCRWLNQFPLLQRTPFAAASPSSHFPSPSTPTHPVASTSHAWFHLFLPILSSTSILLPIPISPPTDLAVSAPYASQNGTSSSSGVVYIFLGSNANLLNTVPFQVWRERGEGERECVQTTLLIPHTKYSVLYWIEFRFMQHGPPDQMYGQGMRVVKHVVWGGVGLVGWLQLVN